MHASLRKRALVLRDDVTARDGSLLRAPGEVLAAVVRLRSVRAAQVVYSFSSGVDPRWTAQYTLRLLVDAQKRGHMRGNAPAAVVERALEHVVSVLEAPPVPVPVVEISAPPRTSDHEEVRAWARGYGVDVLLRQPAHRYAAILSAGHAWLESAFRRDGAPLHALRRKTLARILDDKGDISHHVILDEIDRLLVTAARAEATARALLRKQPDVAALPPPDDEVCAGVLARLLALREKLAKEHGIPLVPKLEEPPSVTFDENPAALITFGGRGGQRVELSQWRQTDLTLDLVNRSRELVPEDAIAALEAMIDLVREPTAREQERLLDLVGRQPWQRLLVALESSAPTAPKAGDDIAAISWRLQPGWYGFDAAPFLHKRKKAGGLTAGTKLALQRILDDDSLPLVPQDRAAASALTSSRYSAVPSGAVLEALAGHPRVFHYDDLETPLTLERARLALLIDEVPGGFRLGLGLGATRLDPQDVSEALERSGTVVTTSPVDATVYVTRVEKQLRPLLDTLCRVDTVIPLEAKDALLRAVHPFEAQLSVRLPTPLQGDVVEGATLPVIRLDPLAGGALRASVGVRPFEGAPFLVPGEGARELTGLVESRRVTAKRDLDSERTLALALVASLPLPDHSEDGPWRFYLADAEEALDVIGALAPDGTPRDDVAVEWPEDRPAPRVARTLTAASLRVEVSERRDWLGLEGGADLDGERVKLALLLDAARTGGRYVRLSEDRFVALSRELRGKLASLAEAASEVRGHVEVGLASASLLEDLKDAGACVEGTRVWSELLERMREARELTPTLPKALTAELRPYQREGFAWLKRLSTWGVGAVLADDMGLGKTLQTLALLVDRQARGPQLVVAPTSVCFSWQREMERFAPSLRPRLLAGNERKGLLENLGPRDVVITSWGVLLRDITALSAIRFATFVMDEAQAIKNAATRRARAARDIDAEWRVALTGTPVENHLGELWAIFRAAAPGLLGSWEQFKARFAVPIERHRDEKARRALSRLIRPFLLRRTKAQVAEDLPSRTEVVHVVELSEPERQAYEDVRLALLAKLEGDDDGAFSVWDGRHKKDVRFEILSALTRLRLRACHPALDGDDVRVPSSKQKAVLRIAADLKDGGHRALVFSQFTSHLKLVRQALEDQGLTTLYLDGSTPQAERARLVDRFQAGEGDLFLISLKAGGVGLNLTAADYVLLLDPWWNPAVEDQAADRTHRIGQTRPVTIYKLVARGTIEESILTLQSDKRRLVDDVLEGTGSAGSMSTRELVALIEQRGHMEARLVPAP